MARISNHQNLRTFKSFMLLLLSKCGPRKNIDPKLLIEVGADVNAQLFGQDLLCEASGEGHYECVNLLLEAGADVNCICEP